MTVAAGERWGSYVLEERIAAGGMAEVFRARRTGAASFSRQVCIKRLHPHLSTDPEFVALFLDEARTGSRLRHRNIVAVEDLGEHDGRYFLAMEYVNGVDLARLAQRARDASEPITPDVAAFIAAELLAALHAAHTALDPDDGAPLRVVHRDVAPHNVLVSYHGEVKLTDFGIARAARRARTTDGAVVRGRFGYMPLEQCSGAELDGRADLFALGVTLYELLAGRRPFRGDDPDATLEAIIAAQVTNDRPPLASLRDDLPQPLLALIESLLAPDARDRPASAAAALDALAALPETSAGGPALAALMARLYPSRASAAYVPRSSLPAPHRTPTPAPGVDPYAATRPRRALALVPDEDAADEARTPVDSGTSTVPDARVVDARAPARPRALVAAGGAIVAVAVAAALVLPPLRRAPAPREAPAAARVVVVATPDAVAMPVAPAEPRAAVVTAPDVTNAPPRAPDPAARQRGPTRAARVSASAPDAAAAPAPVPTGALRVLALPWGEVFAGGRSRGRAPVTVELPPGEHDVRVVRGYDTQSRRVRITEGQVTTEMFEFPESSN